MIVNINLLPSKSSLRGACELISIKFHCARYCLVSAVKFEFKRNILHWRCAYNIKSVRVVCHMKNASCLLSQIFASSQMSLAGVFSLRSAGFNSAGVETTKPFSNASVSYTHIFLPLPSYLIFHSPLFPIFVFICFLPPFSYFFSSRTLSLSQFFPPLQLT